MIRFLNQKHSIYYIILFNFLLRLVIVLTTNLGNDEVYYVNYALYPDLSYFDHPPFVGYLIRLTTFNLQLLHPDFFVRLGSLLIGSFNLYLIYRIGCFLKNTFTANLAALLLSCSLYSTIIVGTFILPDTPLSVFWLLALYFFLKYISSDDSKWLLWFGVTTGFALLSKYQAVFLWIGAISYLFLFDRKKFISPRLYMALGISFLLFTPVLWWNFNSPFSGIAYHESRVGNKDWLPSLDYFFPEFFGQFFYNNPIAVILIIWSLIAFYRLQKKWSKPMLFLWCCSLPLIVTTLCMSFFNRTLPHWSGPSYFSLIILCALSISSLEIVQRKKFISLAYWGHILLTLLIALGIFQVTTGYLLPSNPENSLKTGKNDFTVDIALWPEISAVLAKEIPSTNTSTFIITSNWFPASHIDYYYAQQHNIPLYVVGGTNNKHQYAMINEEKGMISKGSTGYYMTTSHSYRPLPKSLTPLFTQIEDPTILPVVKNGKIRLYIHLYTLNSLLADWNPNSPLTE